jgi:hypothetical protein
MAPVTEDQPAVGKTVTSQSRPDFWSCQRLVYDFFKSPFETVLRNHATKSQWSSFTVGKGKASAPAKEIGRRRSLVFRWFVSELELHKMFWIGPPVTIADEEIPPGDRPRNSLRTWIRTNRSRLEAKTTNSPSLRNEDPLTLVYGTKKAEIDIGCGRRDRRLDNFPRNRTCKALRYGFNILLLV